MSDLAQAQAKADELARAAASHKSAVRFHRRALSDAMRSLEELQAASARRGIHITINAKPRRQGVSSTEGPRT